MIDSENVSHALWSEIKALLTRVFPGRTHDARAYCCGGSTGWGALIGVTIVDGGESFRAKNAADLLLSYHAGLIVGRGEADEIVIVSGDGGMATTAQAIRNAGIPLYAVVPNLSKMPCTGASIGADVTLMLPVGRTKAHNPNIGVEACAQCVPEAAAVSQPKIPSPPQPELLRSLEIMGMLQKCKSDAEGWVNLTDLGRYLCAEDGGLAEGEKLINHLISLRSFDFRNEPWTMVRGSAELSWHLYNPSSCGVAGRVHHERCNDPATAGRAKDVTDALSACVSDTGGWVNVHSIKTEMKKQFTARSWDKDLVALIRSLGNFELLNVGNETLVRAA